MANPLLVIATIMRADGETGVQSHFNAFRRYLSNARIRHVLITPYAAPKVLVYPTFAVRRVLEPVSRPVSVWWYRTWHALFLERALRPVLRRESNAVVYAQCPLSALAALRARTSPTQRVILVVHFNISQADEWVGKRAIVQNGRLYRAIRHFESNLLPRLDGLVFVSRFMQQEVMRRIPRIDRVPTAIIPNFVDAPDAAEPDFTPVDLVSIGTLEPRKNQRFLLEVLAKCAAEGRRYTLTLVGDGPDRVALERFTRDRDLTSQVRFLGFRKNAAKYLTGHRAYCHGALLENLPVAIVEAFSVGLPVFANRVGGIPEMLQDGRQGRFWPIGDVNESAAILMETLDDEATLKRMSSDAKSAFEQRFSSQTVGPRLAEFVMSGVSADLYSGKPVAV